MEEKQASMNPGYIAVIFPNQLGPMAEISVWKPLSLMYFCNIQAVEFGQIQSDPICNRV